MISYDILVKMSFISNQIKAYSRFNSSMSRDRIVSSSHDSILTCLLNLETPSDGKTSYFDWITVPTTIQGVTTPYTVKTLLEYFEYHNWTNVPDPMRCFDNLDFMIPRLQCYLSIDEKTIDFHSDITPEFKQNILLNTIKNWRNMSFDPLPFQMFVGLGTWCDMNMVFSNTNSNQSKNILEQYSDTNGTFLIRESAMNIGDGRGNATIFTISFVNNNCGINYFSVRFMSIHGVGVYAITVIYKNFPSVCISGMPCMRTLTIQDIIRDMKILKCTQPHWPSICHMLTEMHLFGLIDLNEIIIPDPVIGDITIGN
jgi:hypothetical protein